MVERGNLRPLYRSGTRWDNSIVVGRGTPAGHVATTRPLCDAQGTARYLATAFSRAFSSVLVFASPSKAAFMRARMVAWRLALEILAPIRSVT